jgi:integrase/recombinase XerD
VQSPTGETLPPLSWEEAFRLYDDYQRSRRAAPRTLYLRQRALTKLRAALKGEAPTPAHVRLDHLRRYQLSLLTTRRLAAKTVATTTSHIRAFFRFLYLDEHLDKDPAGRLEPPRVPPRLPGELVTPRDMQHMLAATAGSKHPLLDRAILETLYCTGVRRAELLSLDVSDLDHRGRTLLVRCGKGERPRVLPVVPTCYDALLRYLEYCRPELEREPTPPLFVGPRGGRLKSDTLARIVRDLGQRAGLVKPITPHCFRRACATGLLKNGTNLKVIQAVLGHSNLETTSVYLNLSPDEIRSEVLSNHPRERFEA